MTTPPHPVMMRVSECAPLRTPRRILSFRWITKHSCIRMTTDNCVLWGLCSGERTLNSDESCLIFMTKWLTANGWTQQYYWHDDAREPNPRPASSQCSLDSWYIGMSTIHKIQIYLCLRGMKRGICHQIIIHVQPPKCEFQMRGITLGRSLITASAIQRSSVSDIKSLMSICSIFVSHTQNSTSDKILYQR